MCHPQEIRLRDDARQASLGGEDGQAPDAMARQLADRLRHGGPGVGHVERVRHGVADGTLGPAVGIAGHLPHDVPLRDDARRVIVFHDDEAADPVLDEEPGGLVQGRRGGNALHVRRHVLGDPDGRRVLRLGLERPEILGHIRISAEPHPTFSPAMRVATHGSRSTDVLLESRLTFT